VPDAPRRKTGLIIGALALTLVTVVGVVIAVVAANRAATVTGVPTTIIEAEKSDEDQLRDVVDQFEQSWNDKDFDALSELFCEDMRNDPELSRSALRELRDGAGRLTLSVTALDINGDAATATITNLGEDPDDIDFAREDSDWKWCEF
jgi:hypothetical protein